MLASTLVSTSKPLPVLIIGAGIGGLTLAHSLAKHGIPYKIFERDTGQYQRTQGYRVSLDEGGNSALRLATSADVFDRYVATCGENHAPVGRVDARTGRLLRSGIIGLVGTGGVSLIWALLSRYAWKRWERCELISCLSDDVGQAQPSPVVPTTEKSHRQVDRQMLRTVLLESLTDLTYDAAFSSYTVHPDRVTAHFSNGTNVDGSLLVGADGIRSKVAAQLTGGNTPTLDMGVRIIYGKTPLTPTLDEAILPLLRTGVCFIRDDEQDLTVVMVPMRFNHQFAPPDYIFWAISTTADKLGMTYDTLLASQGKAAGAIVDTLTQDWHPQVKPLFQGEHDQTAVLKMTTSHPDKQTTWQTDRRVTVLGDAVHCMPPTGGQGANAALHDAAALGEILARSGEDGREGWSESTIQRFEELVRWNIGDVVGMACIGANKLFGAEIETSRPE